MRACEINSLALAWAPEPILFFAGTKKRKKKSELFLIGPKWLFSLNNEVKEEFFLIFFSGHSSVVIQFPIPYQCCMHDFAKT